MRNRNHGLDAGLALLVCFLFGVLLPARMYGQSLPLVSVRDTFASSALAQREWQLLAASDALIAGLPSVAENLASALVALPAIPPAESAQLAEIRGAALISMGRYSDALAALSSHTEQARPMARLLTGAAVLHLGDYDRARKAIDGLDLGTLTTDEAAWRQLIVGLLASRAGEFTRASEAFTIAREKVSSTQHKALFETLILREQLLSGKANDAVVIELRRTMRDLAGQRGAIEAARLLAITLQQLGRREEAIAVLEEQLRFVSIGEGDLSSQFLMLLGLIAGENTPTGRDALQTLLRLSTDRNLLQTAMVLLAKDPLQNGESRDDFLRFLSATLERFPTHPLTDEILAMRARLYLALGNYSAAEADASRLMEQFPASTLRRGAIRLLAYTAWQRNPPQYRTAAEYLGRLREEVSEGPERYRYSLLMADCYYLNGDYENAAEVYASISGNAPEEDRGKLLHQRTLSDLKAGRFEGIPAYLDEAYANRVIKPVELWQTEWNYINALKSRADLPTALARIRSVLGRSAPTDGLPIELQVRFLWLQGQLAVDNKESAEVPKQMDALLALIDGQAPETLATELLLQVRSRSLLLKGEALMQLGSTDEALTLFNQIRLDYPEVEAAALTFLVEARYYTVLGRLVDAQQRLVALADTRPGSPYAPIALWEAALQAEQRGVNSTFLEALGLLERLATEYSTHPLVFYARLKQGDISRKLSDFAAALLVYEDVIRRFSDHPERYRAELSQADCYFAMSGQNPARLEDAIAAYERLTDLQTAPPELRAEAGFKWGYALARRNTPTRARDVYWLSVQRLLLRSTPNETLGATGRYWLARSLFEFAELSENAKLFQEARNAYSLILDQNLPGENLANARMKRLTEAQLGQ
ncbi:MAG: tetratricopeptide repeat protein [Verrucomicrobiota bacterium]|nr:tetratricopeptide repeat protein [Verrucomicrobiota bacterium]